MSDIKEDYTHNLSKTLQYNTDDPVSQIHELGIDIKGNNIYLHGNFGTVIEECEDEPGVDYKMTTTFIKNIQILQSRSDKTIVIHSMTCGGDWMYGMAIYDAIKSCPNDVVIVNWTHARSMSSIFFQAADKRVMVPTSRFMFHEGMICLALNDNSYRRLLTEVEEETKNQERMLNIYADIMYKSGKWKGKTKLHIYDWLIETMKDKHDVYLTAEETVKYGLADEVFGANGKYDWDELVKVK